ncbi:metal-dependent transcriptional regulator [Lacticaseibacillus saniviri]|uniref:Manganese transport regulator n=1 Tax=Lacticaseibacillus saniviri JCM 17471 = DSM 24301 TaxID=1293598 RepID=A0A0R2MWV5_9LACO|nr:metal-dependent transcriptional regulator [Lacticaseibacillus saniviri]KRO17974.1 Mn-dependent transcriptional regulator [Lacticaseibacillus saniviri JCM 17471 = DSM 24301]MCG4282448.1 metal-dependent transcriptional regulator [Lacticaseibacillus saniviri]
MTPNKEDYLKLIMELGGDEELISNKQIVGGMQVSAASVSEMISKLVEQNYVTHTPYQGIQLTESGRRAAALLVRNHRLWEVFLVQELQYPVDAIHVEAEALEHATTAEMANRLAARLNYPQFCPHGGVIPDASGHYQPQSRLSLEQLEVGDFAIIDRILDESALIDYIGQLNLKIGDQVEITAKSDDTITLKTVDGRQIPFMNARSGHVFVQPQAHIH